MEDFEKQVRKYRREIKALEADKAALEKQAAALEQRAEASEQVKFRQQMADAKLQADYHNLRRFVDALPEDVRRQAQTQIQAKTR
jgi:hypothetical protein